MAFSLPETITIWNKINNDGLGNFSWSEPVQAPARIAFVEEKITTPEGDIKMSKAVFYTEAIISKVDSKVFLGSSSSPTPIPEADDVIKMSQTPSGAGDLKKGW